MRADTFCRVRASNGTPVNKVRTAPCRHALQCRCNLYPRADNLLSFDQSLLDKQSGYISIISLSHPACPWQYLVRDVTTAATAYPHGPWPIVGSLADDTNGFLSVATGTNGIMDNSVLVRNSGVARCADRT